jgi:hypothetical protein
MPRRGFEPDSNARRRTGGRRKNSSPVPKPSGPPAARCPPSRRGPHSAGLSRSPLYSIILSVSAGSCGGSSSPSTFAVVRSPVRISLAAQSANRLALRLSISCQQTSPLSQRRLGNRPIRHQPACLDIHAVLEHRWNPQRTSGTNSPYGIRSWKYLRTRVSPAGTLIASASPFAMRNSTMYVPSRFDVFCDGDHILLAASVLDFLQNCRSGGPAIAFSGICRQPSAKN